jgi:hypothetical protein
MVQFYALSVFINLVAGFYLASESTSQQGGPAPGEGGVLARLRELFDEKGAKFSLGLAALIVGLFKILTPTHGDIPVVGDLLPAAAGLATGGILLLEFFKSSSDLESPAVERLDSNVLVHKRYFGMAAALIGFLHFLMPSVPIF